MVDRLELAKQYVQEMLEQRDDIVGAFVVGSVARGDPDESSDIDLILIVEGDGDEDHQRKGIDTWWDGVYIEATVAPMELYADLGKVLRHRFAATYMNDALILYDPSGTFTRLQEEVQTVFAKPRYIGFRVHPIVRSLRKALADLHAAVVKKDLVGLCPSVTWLWFFLPAVPLLIKGTTPSSTKALRQLESVAPKLRERFYQWQGSSGLSADDVRALLPTASRCLSVAEAGFVESYGDLPSYIAKKAAWMVDNGAHREAFALIWWFVGNLARIALASDDAQLASDAEKLVHTWLHAVGWEGQEVLEEKVRMAEEMVAEVEAMAAHLPSDEG